MHRVSKMSVDDARKMVRFFKRSIGVLTNHHKDIKNNPTNWPPSMVLQCKEHLHANHRQLKHFLQLYPELKRERAKQLNLFEG